MLYEHLTICLSSTGKIVLDVVSRELNIERGVIQGDPLSSVLFEAVLEDVFKELKAKWQRNIGLDVGSKACEKATAGRMVVARPCRSRRNEGPRTSHWQDEDTQQQQAPKRAEC